MRGYDTRRLVVVRTQSPVPRPATRWRSRRPAGHRGLLRKARTSGLLCSIITCQETANQSTGMFLRCLPVNCVATHPLIQLVYRYISLIDNDDEPLLRIRCLKALSESFCLLSSPIYLDFSRSQLVHFANLYELVSATTAAK